MGEMDNRSKRRYNVIVEPRIGRVNIEVQEIFIMTTAIVCKPYVAVPPGIGGFEFAVPGVDKDAGGGRPKPITTS
jgi:hypothetical protein